MKTSIHLIIPGRLAALLGLLPLKSTGALIVNGGFESGFSDWTLVNQLGSEGSFHLQTGVLSPVVGDAVPAPPEGTKAAMTDAEGPGAHVLYQVFTPTSAVTSASMTFDLYIGNRAGEFFVPDPETLDFATPELNQQARVDILRGDADPFSVDPSDVLLSLFQTVPDDLAESGYTQYSHDVAALLNGNLNLPLMLRFAETDNVFTFQFGVDNVEIDTGEVVPESLPASAAFLVLLGLCWAARHLRARGRPA